MSNREQEERERALAWLIGDVDRRCTWNFDCPVSNEHEAVNALRDCIPIPRSLYDQQQEELGRLRSFLKVLASEDYVAMRRAYGMGHNLRTDLEIVPWYARRALEQQTTEGTPTPQDEGKG